MGLFVLATAINMLVMTFCMYVASKLSFVEIELRSAFIISVLVSLISLIPTVGGLLGVVAFVYLLGKASNGKLSDCIWVVLFTKLISIGVMALAIA